tara:strand:+ start:35529 stop:35840 length:312 start_codon:yes stop_codon:yes gene_type:complete
MFPGPVAYRTKRGDVSVIPAASTRFLFVVKLDGLGPAAQAEHLRDPVSVALFLRGHWCRSARFDPVVLAGFGDHFGTFAHSVGSLTHAEYASVPLTTNRPGDA